MEADFTGGCLCREVRYRCVGEPISTGLCQCTRCQRQSGSAFLIALVFPRDLVSVTGALNVYATSTVDGSECRRHFCPRCGAGIMMTFDREPELCSILGGTLDDGARVRPTFSLWCSSAQPWLRLPPEIVKYPDYPDGLVS